MSLSILNLNLVAICFAVLSITVTNSGKVMAVQFQYIQLTVITGSKSFLPYENLQPHHLAGILTNTTKLTIKDFSISLPILEKYLINLTNLTELNLESVTFNKLPDKCDKIYSRSIKYLVVNVVNLEIESLSEDEVLGLILISNERPKECSNSDIEGFEVKVGRRFKFKFGYHNDGDKCELHHSPLPYNLCKNRNYNSMQIYNSFVDINTIRSDVKYLTLMNTKLFENNISITEFGNHFSKFERLWSLDIDSKNTLKLDLSKLPGSLFNLDITSSHVFSSEMSITKKKIRKHYI